MLSPSLVGLIASIVVAVLLVFPLRDALRKAPWVFYLVALAAGVLYVYARTPGAAFALPAPMTVVMQKGYLASILLGVVMFCGCFDEGTPARKRIQPVRGELSILSFILILGHLAAYLPSYLPRLGTILALRGNIAASLIVAVVLAVIFALLTVTSPRAVRRAMNARVWKAIQRLAYVMVALLAVHVALVLGRSAFVSGAVAAQVSLGCYLVVIAVYAVLRIAKAVRDRRRRAVKGDNPL